MNLLPLEKVFESKAADKHSFPKLETDYVLQYKSLVEYLRTNIYNLIDTGLAANSQSSGFYTAHGADHFDEVVRYAGFLLGVEKGDEKVDLSPYELYFLLVAIRIHDAGNIHGREEHEKKCFTVLKNSGIGTDIAEKKRIAFIAQAHGGKTSDDSLDTISRLSVTDAIGSQSVRPQLLASIVRFADEICENNSRAASYLLKFGTLPKHSEIYHKYAASITSNTVSIKDGIFTIKFEIQAEDVTKPWGCTPKNGKIETYLIDEIFERLEKMDKERRYCNRFSRSLYVVNSIRASIDIINKEHEVIDQIAIPELCDSGYPEDNNCNLKVKLHKYCGSLYGEKLQNIIIGRNQ